MANETECNPDSFDRQRIFSSDNLVISPEGYSTCSNDNLISAASFDSGKHVSGIPLFFEKAGCQEANLVLLNLGIRIYALYCTSFLW